VCVSCVCRVCRVRVERRNNGGRIKPGFFDVYVKYINNFQSAIETLNRCKAEDPAMTKFIAECEAKKECGYMDLSSFLIQPVQRIPRYVLLLNQLLRYLRSHKPLFFVLFRFLSFSFTNCFFIYLMRRKTTAGTKVHAELYRAVEKMRQATHHLNEQKRYHMLQLSFTGL